jgi:hypothetical protein
VPCCIVGNKKDEYESSVSTASKITDKSRIVNYIENKMNADYYELSC